MKRLCCFVLLLVFLLPMAACSSVSAALPVWRDLFYLNRNPLPEFSTAQSQAMHNCMHANRVLLAEDVLYTLELASDETPILACYRLTEGRLSAFRELARPCVPQWICTLNGKLYYVNTYRGQRLEELDPVSGELRVLYEGECSYLQSHDNSLYFRNQEGLFCALNPVDGTIQLWLDKPCCYPYFLGDVLLYQSESEGEILKLRYDREGKIREIALTETAAYAPMVLGDRLYFTSEGQVRSMRLDGLSPALCESIPLSGAAEFVLTDGRWLARGISQDYGIQQWLCALPNGTMEASPITGYTYCDFAGGQWRVEADYFSDARLRAFVLFGSEGACAEYLYGQVRTLR